VPRTRKIVSRRKIESVRERADKHLAKSSKSPSSRKTLKSTRGLKKVLAREFHPIKLPNNKLGNTLTKRRSATPSYFVNSLRELKLVDWPSRRQALSLSMAVIVFSVTIAIFVQLLDYGLGKLFKEVILK
jgi:preprotein translocase SecE subunit